MIRKVGLIVLGAVLLWTLYGCAGKRSAKPEESSKGKEAAVAQAESTPKEEVKESPKTVNEGTDKSENKENEKNKSQDNKQQAAETKDENQEEEAGEGTAEGNAGVNDGQEKDYGEIGFDLVKNESLGSLKYGLTEKELVQKLGQPEEKSKAMVWGSDGMEHQSFYYKAKGIELDMIKDENVWSIRTINIKKPCDFKTKRNIGIGSSKEEVLKVYKEELNPENSGHDTESYIAGTVYGGIIFGFENGEVSSIFIGAAAE
ncbi:MAG: hypothetical protein N2484_01040 [Clostridia bacterium]|nr:hypothetical protein [Clostridia bacterium]